MDGWMFFDELNSLLVFTVFKAEYQEDVFKIFKSS